MALLLDYVIIHIILFLHEFKLSLRDEMIEERVPIEEEPGFLYKVIHM